MNADTIWTIEATAFKMLFDALMSFVASLPLRARVLARRIVSFGTMAKVHPSGSVNVP